MTKALDLEEERRQHIIEEGKKPLSSDNPEFLSWLGDESWRVRKEAVNQLAANPDTKNVIPLLIEAMADEANAGLRNSAFSLLILLGSKAIEALLTKADTDDEDLRKFIIDLLGQIPDERSIPQLIKALDDQCINVKLSAIESLGRIKAKEAKPRILGLLRETSDPISLATILEALYQLDVQLPPEELPKLITMPLIGPSLVKIMSISDGPAIGHALVNIAISEEYGPTARVAALSCLLPLFEKETLVINTESDERSRLADYLTSLIASDDPNRQILALKLVKYFHSQELLEQALLNATNVNMASYLAPIILSYDAADISQACQKWHTYPEASKELLLNTIGRLNLTDFRQLLLSIICDTSFSVQIQRAAISALGAIGDISTLDIFVPMLSVTDQGLNRHAAAALQSLCLHVGQNCADKLRLTLLELPPTTAAIEVLGKIAQSSDLPQICSWLKNDNSEIRLATLQTLMKFHDQLNIDDIKPLLNDSSATVRAAVIKLLATTKDAAIEAILLNAIDDYDLSVSLAAIEALTYHQSPTVIATLRNLITNSCGPKAITALRTLANMSSSDLTDIIRAAINAPDAEVVQEAIGDIDRLPVEYQKEILLSLLDHEIWNVRLAALQMVMALDLEIPAQQLNSLLTSETDPMIREVLEEIRG